MSNSDPSRSALCVIDIQKDFTALGWKYAYQPDQLEGLIANTNEAIRRAQDQGMKIVYVKQEYRAPWRKLLARLFFFNKGIAGTPGVDIDPRINVVSTNIFSKQKDSAFSNPEFKAFLQNNRIEDVYLAGLDGCMCVNGTLKSARKEGYRVHVITDAVITGFRARWQNMLERYVKSGISLTWAADF